MRIQYETHLHSEFSLDSTTPVKEQLKRADELGLTGICFTDHYDYGFPVDQCPGYKDTPFIFDVDKYQNTIRKEREMYPGLSVGIGVELGLQADEEVVNFNQKFVTDHDWDQVIGSIHLIDKKDPYYPTFWDGKNYEEIIRNSFVTTLKNLESFTDFDILGHLDYTTRYIPSDGIYEPEKYMEIIDEILRIIIRKNIALEINTGALHKSENGVINPHPVIVKHYYEMGGRLVSIGSDAHKPEPLAFGFDHVAELLTQIGFTQYVTFTNRNMILHKLL